MKRFISILLSAILLFLIFTPIYLVIDTQLERKSVINFCNAVSSLNNKYDSNVSYLLKDETGKDNIGLNADRLVIKTDSRISGTNEMDSVYGLDWAVLQYSDRGDMLSDYESLNAQGYIVEKDTIFYLDDARDAALKANTNTDVPFDYAYTNSGADYVNKFFDGSDDEIIIGIMDSGIDYNHSEFRGRYIQNPVNFSTSGNADNPMDERGHGTACASIVIQSTPDNVKVKPYKIFNKEGSASLSTIIAAVEYILAETDKPDVINMSFCGYELDGENQIQNELASRIVENGIAVCTAAGNESAPSEYASPAGCDDVITVASHDGYNKFSTFSNYGKAVDITAPGENIFAARLGGGYVSDFTGTSFSVPLVSAACAYVLMQHADYTPAQIKETIKSAAVDMGDYDRFYYGAGILNFVNLMDDIPYEVPSASVQGGLYHDAQEIEFNSIPDDARLIYTTDATVPTAENGTEYTGAITVENDTLLTFALMHGDEYLSPISSNYYTIQYYAQSSDFIMISGVITSCLTNKKNIVVPDTINGKTPVGLVASLFRYSNLESIVLPDSITELGLDCFYSSKKLKRIVANGVTTFKGDNTFSDCVELRDISMPKLKTVGASAFKNCAKLHEIDFGENLTEFKNSMFAGSGLMYGNFPNVQMNGNSAKEVFKDCPISYCFIPGVTVLSEGLFNGCRYLCNLTIGKVNAMYAKALAECYFVNKLDTSGLSVLGADALYSCHLDTLYAPECRQLPSRFGQYCYVRVIDLPKATGLMGGGMFDCATTQELYLDSATNMISQSALKNVIDLRIIYLPRVTDFYGTYTKVSNTEQMLFGNYWETAAPIETIWIPRANILSELNLTHAKLIFAPNTRFFNVNFASTALDTKIVLSEKVLNGFLTINSSVSKPYNNVFTIIAPETSYAHTYAESKKDLNFKFVSFDDCVYTGNDMHNDFVYSLIDDEMSIPADYILPCWNEYDINKSRYSSSYKFLLDFTNDDVINAKDYSILIRSTGLSDAA